VVLQNLIGIYAVVLAAMLSCLCGLQDIHADSQTNMLIKNPLHPFWGEVNATTFLMNNLALLEKNKAKDLIKGVHQGLWKM